ncbi:MAG: hypothetical protein LQ343_007247 [Gyalolechia ehrenbergii]|nr:MAG: hypothetical protein LQ343_007247 [Gyalolechia ehrenbergii]
MRLCLRCKSTEAIVNTREICVDALPWLGHDRSPEYFGAVTVLLILSTLAVVLRFLARSIARSSYGYDDWIMLFALVWEYGLCICSYFSIHNGSGKHILMVDLDEILNFGKLFFTGTLLFAVGCFALKLSILFFYHRIFAVRKFTIWCIAIGIVSVAWFIAFIVSQFLICRPVECFWDKSIPDCKCVNATHIGLFVTSPPDILTNIALLILPIPWLWNLQMRRGKKIAITFIFLLDSIVNSAIWINVELAIGIVSACLPLMRPLASHAFPSEIRSRFYRSGRSSGSHRLPDSGNRKSGSRINAIGSDGGIYAGGSGTGSKKGPKSWYNNITAVTRTADGEIGEGSEEDMVPMGRIQVRSDLEWEQEEGIGGKDGR